MRESQGSAEMSPLKLTLILLILGVVWILCYQAEGSMESRNQMNFYDLIGDRNISEEMYKKAVRQYRRQTDKLYKQENNLSQMYNNKKQIDIKQQQICIILLNKGDISIDLLKLTLQSINIQKYSNFNVVYYSISNNLNQFKFIQEYIQNYNLSFHIIKSKQYSNMFITISNIVNKQCKNYSFIGIIYAGDILLGQNALSIMNTVINKFNKKIVWSQSIYNSSVQEENVKKGIGLSFPYPPNVISKNSYRTYHLLVDEFYLFSSDLFLKAEDIYTQKQKQQFGEAAQLAYMLPMLEMAGDKVAYENVILYGRYKDDKKGIHGYSQSLQISEQESKIRKMPAASIIT